MCNSNTSQDSISLKRYVCLLTLLPTCYNIWPLLPNFLAGKNLMVHVGPAERVDTDPAQVGWT